jgi:hypothetical protein
MSFRDRDIAAGAAQQEAMRSPTQIAIDAILAEGERWGLQWALETYQAMGEGTGAAAYVSALEERIKSVSRQ